MIDTPVIRIELEGLKQSVRHMFTTNHGELTRLVEETFEKQLTEEWIHAEVNRAVHECIQAAIKNLSSNYTLQSNIETLINEKLREVLND